MFALGIIGIFQVLLLPGLILRRWLQFPRNFFLQTAAVVASSLIANYLLVFLLTSLRLFRPWVCFLLIAAECAYLLYRHGRKLLTLRLDVFLADGWNRCTAAVRALLQPLPAESEDRWKLFFRAVFLLLFFIAALTALNWVWGYLEYNLGRVFETWDAVVSWNRWAVDWAGNHFPLSTQDYPQLIPTSWAMIYTLIGTTEVQFFSKSIMPLFSLLIMLLMLGMGLETKNAGYFLGVILFRYFLKKFLLEFIISGYVDLPLAFFGFLAVLLLWYAWREPDAKRKMNLLAQAVLFASGAAVTKQAGLYLLGLVFVLGVGFAHGRPNLKRYTLEWRKYLLMVLIPLILVVPWYAYKFLNFAPEVETSHLMIPIDDTQNAHDTAHPLALILNGLKSLGNPLAIFLFLIPALLVVENYWRWITLTIVLPFTLIWAFYASYDTRNLTMMLPLAAVIAGMGVMGFAEWVLTLSQKLKLGKLPVAVMPALLALAVIGLTIVFPREKLLSAQVEQQKQIFSPQINTQLYEYQAANGLQGKILTNYPVHYLPDLAGFQIVFWYQDAAQLQAYLAQEEVQYLLYPANSSPAVLAMIEEQIALGKLRVVFTNSDYISYTFAEVLRDE